MATVERLVEDRISQLNNNQHTLHGTQGGKRKETADGESSHTKVDRVTFKAFKGCGAAEYKGTETPLGACAWIDNIEKVFAISHCWEEDQVIYAAAILIDDALSWWSSRKSSLGEERVKVMTWAEFKAEFMQQYCPRDQRDKYEQEFISLQQGTRTVTAYEAEFNRKSKFATALISSEEVKVRRFIQGLRWSIRETVQMQSPVTLADATRYARMREDILETRDTEIMPSPKRSHIDHSTSYANDQSSTYIPNSKPRCNQCGRRHFGICRNPNRTTDTNYQDSSSVTCRRCGKTGHIAPDCMNIPLGCFKCGSRNHFRRDCPQLAPTDRLATITRPSTSNPVVIHQQPTSTARPRAYQVTAEEPHDIKHV